MKFIPIFVGIAVIFIIAGIGLMFVPQIQQIIDEQIKNPIDLNTALWNAIPNLLVIIGVWIFITIAIYYLRFMSIT